MLQGAGLRVQGFRLRVQGLGIPSKVFQGFGLSILNLGMLPPSLTSKKDRAAQP